MTGEAADKESPELVDEVALLLREVVYDRVRPDVVPRSLHVDPEWLENAAESEYGLLAERLDEYKLQPPSLTRCSGAAS